MTETNLTDPPVPNRLERDSILWAIEPGALNSIIERASVPGVVSRQDDGRARFAVRDGIAVVPVIGPLARRLGGWDLFDFDGTDSDELIADLQMAAEDPSVLGVILHIDSPGGTVAGTQEVADVVKAMKKPVLAFTDGGMMSAAYWIGSSADAVFATPTAQIGSVGVIATHVDRSKFLDRIGIKVTHISAGALKAIGSDAAPLSDDGRAYIQSRVDAIFDLFVEDIAGNRGMNQNAIRGMEAGVFLGKQAMEQGLIDGIASLQGVYSIMKRRIGIMDINEFKTNFAALYQDVLDAGRASITEADVVAMFPGVIEAARTEGAVRERTRIVEIRDAAFEGQKELADKLIADGVSADEARKTILADQKAKNTAELAAMANADPGPMGDNLKGDATGTPAGLTAKDAEEAGDKLHEIAVRIKSEKGVSYSDALKAAMTENPKLADAYRTR